MQCAPRLCILTWNNCIIQGTALKVEPYHEKGISYEQALLVKLQTEYWPTVLIELLVWPGWQIITFRVVPLHHQLMTSNLLTLGEATALPFVNAMPGKDTGKKPM